ncbi:hypothetical protein F5Y09DRAFT_323166 [Xylaria sp. FL1042]|nr:hypothetical protein F5Y09DRAFT_323166 [Xylaria sp. FL1042]
MIVTTVAWIWLGKPLAQRPQYTYCSQSIYNTNNEHTGRIIILFKSGTLWHIRRLLLGLPTVARISLESLQCSREDPSEESRDGENTATR